MRGQSQFNESWGKHQTVATQKKPNYKQCVNPRAAAKGNIDKMTFIDDQGRKVEVVNGVKTVLTIKKKRNEKWNHPFQR